MMCKCSCMTVGLTANTRVFRCDGRQNSYISDLAGQNMVLGTLRSSGEARITIGTKSKVYEIYFKDGGFLFAGEDQKFCTINHNGLARGLRVGDLKRGSTLLSRPTTELGSKWDDCRSYISECVVDSVIYAGLSQLYVVESESPVAIVLGYNCIYTGK